MSQFFHVIDQIRLYTHSSWNYPIWSLQGKKFSSKKTSEESDYKKKQENPGNVKNWGQLCYLYLKRGGAVGNPFFLPQSVSFKCKFYCLKPIPLII